MRPLPLPPASPGLTARGLSLRPATAADADFLRDLYVAGRWTEVAVTGWPSHVIVAFLQDQHRLQLLHYDRHYADALRLVVECEGAPAGKLFLLDMVTELRIVDFGLMPAFRGRGIGALLLSWTQDVARGLGPGRISLHVDPSNPVKRLYERMGFQAVELRGTHELMEWQAAS